MMDYAPHPDHHTTRRHCQDHTSTAQRLADRAEDAAIVRRANRTLARIYRRDRIRAALRHTGELFSIPLVAWTPPVLISWWLLS